MKADSRTRGSRLWVWNVHGPVLWTESGRRRDILRCGFLEQLRSARETDPDRYELIVGDFNLFPYDELITSSSGLCANRSYDWVIKENPKEVARRRLFNPTWALLGLSQAPGSSFFHRSLEGGPWVVQDQALMSAALGLPGERQVHLIDRVRHVDGTATDLCTGSNRSPNKKIGSDHLPICVKFQAA